MYKILAKIQSELKAPKGQYNSFGKYKYRSAEDILTAAKPLCVENGVTLTVSDEIALIGDRYYLKATATITGEKGVIETSAFAREPLTLKGQSESQITGTASSYARKYALNGLFAIDDTKDADTDEFHNQATNTPKKKPDYKALQSLLDTKVVDIKAFFKYYKIEKITDLKGEDFYKATSALMSKPDKKKEDIKKDQIEL